MVIGNGSSQAVCLGFEVIRGSPILWEAYKKEAITFDELKLVLSWLKTINPDLWKRLSAKQAEVDAKMTQRFKETVTRKSIWIALNNQQITFPEFYEEILCRLQGQTITALEERWLIELALKALEY